VAKLNICEFGDSLLSGFVMHFAKSQFLVSMGFTATRARISHSAARQLKLKAKICPRKVFIRNKGGSCTSCDVTGYLAWPLAGKK